MVSNLYSNVRGMDLGTAKETLKKFISDKNKTPEVIEAYKVARSLNSSYMTFSFLLESDERGKPAGHYKALAIKIVEFEKNDILP